MEFTTHNTILLLVFVTALVMGAVVNKTNFCTMGAVSDWVNMGDKGRLRAWMLAMAVAILGLMIMEASRIFTMPLDSGKTFPTYRTTEFAWLRHIVGGVIFGIGMTLGSGCGNKTLIRIGGGNLKSVIVLVMMALTAYMMLWGINLGGLSLNFQSLNGWFLTPTTISLGDRGFVGQDFGALIAGVTGAGVPIMRIIMAVLVAGLMFFFVFKDAEFRSNRDNILAGVVVGLAIIAGWYLTGGGHAAGWIEDAEFADPRPIRVATQSFTFVSAAGDAGMYLLNLTHTELVNFGIMALLGVIAGSLLYAVLSKSFRIEWFANGKDAVTHIVGGLLMGYGGVLAMGCTIGQGITGISTLALGSFLAVGAIIFGSALTMKIQFAMLEEMGFLQAVRSALADFRLVPRARPEAR